MRVEVTPTVHEFLGAKDAFTRIIFACRCGWTVAAETENGTAQVSLTELAAQLEAHIGDPTA